MGIDKELKNVIENEISKLGFETSEIKFVNEDGENYLRITIDKDEEVTFDDVSLVSEKISLLLDELDPIQSNYTLDISSLGAEKPIKLEKLEKYVSKYVNIHLTNPYKGENYLEGYLLEVDDENVKLEIRIKSNKKSINLERKNIDKARLAIKF